MCSEEERRWLAEAVEMHMAEDVVSRLREIALLMSTPLSVLEAQGITPDDIEGTDSQLSTLARCHAKGDKWWPIVVLSVNLCSQNLVRMYMGGIVVAICPKLRRWE